MPRLTNDESSASPSKSPAATGNPHLDHQPTIASLLRIIESGCLLSEFGVARITGLSVKTLRQWRIHKRGLHQHIKLGRAVRYDPRDIAAFIEAGRRTLP
jgi:hypothetical protein